MDRATIDLEILTKLDALQRSVDANTAAIRELAGTRRNDEDAKLTALLAAISAELGSEPWTVVALFDLALAPPVPGAKDLLRAIMAIAGKRKSGNPRYRLGRFFSQ